jgi:hypothetical protein
MHLRLTRRWGEAVERLGTIVPETEDGLDRWLAILRLHASASWALDAAFGQVVLIDETGAARETVFTAPETVGALARAAAEAGCLHPARVAA